MNGNVIKMTMPECIKHTIRELLAVHGDSEICMVSLEVKKHDDVMCYQCLQWIVIFACHFQAQISI